MSICSEEVIEGSHEDRRDESAKIDILQIEGQLVKYQMQTQPDMK